MKPAPEKYNFKKEGDRWISPYGTRPRLGYDKLQDKLAKFQAAKT